MKQKVAAVFVFVLSLVLNGLAGSTTILGGITTAEVSDAHPTLFTPAGVTFSIWGIIYTLVIIYCVRLMAQGRFKRPEVANKLAESLALNLFWISLVNTAWILAWQYRILWLSLLLIILLLVLLAKAAHKTVNKKLQLVDWLTVKLPFSVYFGWVTVATIANISVWLVSINWNPWFFSAPVWTAIILVVGALIAIHNAWRLKDWAYIAVFVWAYGGIWIAHTSAQYLNNSFPGIVQLLVGTITVLTTSAIWFWYRWPLGRERKGE